MRATIVCSEEDKAYLRRLGIKNVHAVPNGTAIDVADAGVTAQVTNPGAVFLGNMGYSPNIDGVEYFDKEILPLIRADKPDFQLDIVGPKPGVMHKLSEHVRFLGFADDLPRTLQSYSVMNVPLRFGGGTKLKVLDAMASGVPLVSTSVGTEGLKIEHGTHALVADRPEDFAGHVLNVVNDRELAMKLSSNAQTMVMQNFSWNRIRQDITALLLSLDLN